MKVLFFLGSPNPSPDACWTRVGSFADYFKGRGCDVAVVGTFSPISLNMAGSKSWKGIPIYNVIPFIPAFWIQCVLALIFNVFSSIILAPIIFLTLKPKVIVISLPTGEPTVGAYLAARLTHAKVVFDVRDEWEDYTISKASSKTFRRAYKLLKALMTSLYNRGDLVVAVTQPVARSLMLRDVKGVKIVPNGADVNIFRPYEKDAVKKKLGIKEDEFVIVYEGTVGGYYRLDIVVRSIAKLDNAVRNKIRLVILGRGDISNVLRLAESSGLKSNIVYLGIKSDKVELAQIISAGDVGIVPYDENLLWKNSMPAKFYEYCACGIPVIATVYDDSLLADMIKEHEIGLYTPPMDDERLSKAILWIYRNVQLREVMGRRARMLIEERFDRSKIAKEFLKLVEKCVSNG